MLLRLVFSLSLVIFVNLSKTYAQITNGDSVRLALDIGADWAFAIVDNIDRSTRMVARFDTIMVSMHSNHIWLVYPEHKTIRVNIKYSLIAARLNGNSENNVASIKVIPRLNSGGNPHFELIESRKNNLELVVLSNYLVRLANRDTVLTTGVYTLHHPLPEVPIDLVITYNPSGLRVSKSILLENPYSQNRYYATTKPSLVKNLSFYLVPGSFQKYTGERNRGLFGFAGTGFLTGIGIITTQSYNKSLGDFKKTRDRYRKSVDVSEIPILASELRLKHREAQVKLNRSRLVFGLLGLAYLSNAGIVIMKSKEYEWFVSPNLNNFGGIRVAL